MPVKALVNVPGANKDKSHPGSSSFFRPTTPNNIAAGAKVAKDPTLTEGKDKYGNPNINGSGKLAAKTRPPLAPPPRAVGVTGAFRRNAEMISVANSLDLDAAMGASPQLSSMGMPQTKGPIKATRPMSAKPKKVGVSGAAKNIVSSVMTGATPNYAQTNGSSAMPRRPGELAFFEMQKSICIVPHCLCLFPHRDLRFSVP